MLFNMERARGLMSDLGVDVLIATTPENVTYLSNYSAWGMWIYRGNTSKKGNQTYAIFPRDPGTSPALIPVSSGYTTFSYLALTPSWT
jgi:Xaa-Pro aminopeptidase